MLSDDKLRDIASSILWKTNPESVFLSRLSSLTLISFLYSPTLAQSSCGYILQMLNYVYEPSVLFLFKTICSSKNKNTAIQQWLLSLNFPDILYKEIERFHPSRDASYFDIDANQYCGLIKIVKCCTNSPLLSTSVRTLKFVELLNFDLEQYPRFVENYRWETAAALHCAHTADLLRAFFNQAINLIVDLKSCPTLSGVSAIKLLTKMVEDRGIPVSSLKTYIDSFKYGCPPHGGAGLGLERVVMLILGIEDVR